MLDDELTGRRSESYLGSGRQDLDTAVVADIGRRVEKLLDVVDDPVQLNFSGHRVFAGPEYGHTNANSYSPDNWKKHSVSTFICLYCTVH